MSKKKEPERRSQTETVRVPLCMPAELDARITETAAAVKLSKQDTMRLSLERGLWILKKQLAPQAA